MASNDAPESQELQSIGLELEQVDVYSKYMLSTPLEVLFILRSLAKQACMATVYFNYGRSFFLTCLLAVTKDEKNLVLDIGSDLSINREALKANRLMVTTNLDNVKVQFVLSGLQEVTYEGRPAFLAAIPPSLLRLQRREYFRLEIPLAEPVRCQAPILGEDQALHTLDLSLLDISGGGLCLKVANEAAPFFGIGETLKNCHLHVPDESVISVNLRIRNIFAISNRERQEYFRVGCEFIDLPGARLNMIQRYITRIERQRKARLSGLG